MDRDHARRLARMSLLAALAMVLSFIETMIPLPVTVPGLKLGLSNIAVLIALYSVDARCAGWVALIKVLSAGFIFGSPMMIAYSAGGTLLAFVGMVVCKRLSFVSVVVTSMVAAVLHNTGQLLVACAMLRTWAVMVNLAPLALAACVTGAISGAVAAAVLPLAHMPADPPMATIGSDDVEELGIQPGAHIAFVGVNGSGKSSYARALTARDDLGTVMLAFQDADGQIVRQTVRDDVAFGLENRGVAQERMERMVADELERVGLGERDQAAVERLSGGQKQLVVLAGLAVLAPDVLIFDETSSMMDEASRGVFARVLEELTACGTCVVCITQLADEAFAADRIALFSKGRIEAVATPEQLRGDDSLLHRVGLDAWTGHGDIAADASGDACIPLARGQEQRLVPAPGEVVGVRGSNGAGKSTALEALAHSMGERAAIVRQRPECQLFAETAYDDVAFGPRNAGCSEGEVERRVEAAFGLVGLDAQTAHERSPFAYSGGERRRLALAGALALERPVLLLDEPTAGLDAGNAAMVWELISHLRDAGRGIVVVSHDVAALAVCATRVFHLEAPAGARDDAMSASNGSTAFGVYRERASVAHGLDPRAKVVFSLLFLVACACAQSVPGMLLIGAVTVAQLALAKCAPRETWRTLRAFVPLIAFVAVFDALFHGGDAVLFELGPVCVSAEGLVFAAESVVRFACALLGTAQLMATTRPIQLSDALSWLLSPLKHLGMSIDDLSFGLNATFRFIPVISEEFERVRRSQEDRGASFSQGSVFARVRSYIPVLVPLFAGVFSRADTLAAAICNRASAASCAHTCIRRYRFAVGDAILLAVGVATVVVTVLL